MRDFYARHHLDLLQRFSEVKPKNVRGRWAASLAYWVAEAMPEQAEEFTDGLIRQWSARRAGLLAHQIVATIAASRASGMKPPLTVKDFLPEYPAHGSTANGCSPTARQ